MVSPGQDSKSLRDYLLQLDPKLGEAANETWKIARYIHELQAEKTQDENGLAHIEKVEENIWALLQTPDQRFTDYKIHITDFDPFELYVLSCAVCCHDFDKGLDMDISSEKSFHGIGSGEFVFQNWDRFKIVSQAAAVAIDSIIRIHNHKENFDQELQRLQDFPYGSNRRTNLKRLATVLKIADTLHLDETRKSGNENSVGIARLKRIVRKNTTGWEANGRRIYITLLKDPDHGNELEKSTDYMRNTEWPPIARSLREFGFPDEIEIQFQTAPNARSKIESEIRKISEKVSIDQITAKNFVLTEEPLRIVAVPAELLAEDLAAVGKLTVVNNTYVQPILTELGSKRGAVNRIYLGPANCGKTRASYERICEITGLDSNAWIILRPESGFIPSDITKISIDWDYAGKRNFRNKAILFLDDLPNHLPPVGQGVPASEAVHSLLKWFSEISGFQERLLLGTIRSETMHDKPDWPEKLTSLGDLQIVRVEPLNLDQRRDLWQGMNAGQISLTKGLEPLSIEVEDDFLDVVAEIEADPETIAYYVRSMAQAGKQRLFKEDAESFTNNISAIWKKLTWPTIRSTYGPAASAFITLARFLEAGVRDENELQRNLHPMWEYHVVFGPPLMIENDEDGTDYLAAVERMIQDGHAVGKPEEWVRPRFDFLLQAHDLADIEFDLPQAEWFSKLSEKLSPAGQARVSCQLYLSDKRFMGEQTTTHWLFGWACALSINYFLQKPDVQNLQEILPDYEQVIDRIKEEKSIQKFLPSLLMVKGFILRDLNKPYQEITAYDELMNRFGEEQDKTIRIQVAQSLINKARALSKLKCPDKAIATLEELVRRFGNDQIERMRVIVANALFLKGDMFEELNQPIQEIAAWDEVINRFGQEKAEKTQLKVAQALLGKGLALDRLGQHDAFISVIDKLVYRYKQEQSPEIRAIVADVLTLQALSFARVEQHEREIAAYDELIKCFGEDQTERISDCVENAFYFRGSAYHALNKIDLAIAAYDELISRYRSAESVEIKKHVAEALFHKGVALGQLGKYHDAIAAYDELIDSFGDEKDIEIIEQVAKALFNKGSSLEELGQRNRAIAMYDELIDRFGEEQAAEIQEVVKRAVHIKNSLS